MRTTHTCPKCKNPEVLFFPQIADRDDDDNVKPLSTHVVHFDWKDDVEVGKLQAYICRTCGFTELYTNEVPLIPWQTVPGAKLLTPKDPRLDAVRPPKPKRWRMRGSRSLLAAALVASAGCFARPPASQLPSAAAALDRLRETGKCGVGVQANAKIDHFGKEGRVRADLLMFVAAPASLRMDVVSPFGATLATLTSDGSRFALADLRDKRFYVGPASACNIARLTTVPVPGHVLVDLLRGQAPVLKRVAEPTIDWSGSGYYVLRIASTRDAREELHIAPHPADFGKPWSEQRMRLLDVKVEQYGGVVYHAELADHRPTTTAPARLDPDGIEPPLPPSGPECNAEIPRRIHVEVPDEEADVVFRYENVKWNPPLPQGTFTQPPPRDADGRPGHAR